MISQLIEAFRAETHSNTLIGQGGPPNMDKHSPIPVPHSMHFNTAAAPPNQSRALVGIYNGSVTFLGRVAVQPNSSFSTFNFK